jgi:ribosome-binding ATPase YchF (GTP1/OBG family)
MLKAKDKEAMENYEIIETLIAGLNKVGGPGNISSNDTEGKQDPDNIEELYKIKNNHLDLFKELNLFYFKPVIIIANLSEDKKDNEFYNNLVKTMNNNIIIKIYAKLENELQELPEGERQVYRDELGIEKDGIVDFIKTSYRLLNLITFYTANENEAKAWPVSGKTRLIEAAGKIHTDMQKGFIKAEVINCEDLLRIGSINRAREDGRVRLEGKDYIVNDKDVIQIKFSS